MASSTNIQTKKIELIQWLSIVEDIDILNKISDLITNERKKDWWSNVSKAERSSIEKGIKDVDSGKLNPHSRAREIYVKWL